LTYPQAILGGYDFLILAEHNQSYTIFNNILALSFVMALNSAQVSEAPKITSIHHKSNPTCVWPLPEASDYSL